MLEGRIRLCKENAHGGGGQVFDRNVETAGDLEEVPLLRTTEFNRDLHAALQFCLTPPALNLALYYQGSQGTATEKSCLSCQFAEIRPPGRSVVRLEDDVQHGGLEVQEAVPGGRGWPDSIRGACLG